jgi:hypothetical protein
MLTIASTFGTIVIVVCAVGIALAIFALLRFRGPWSNIGGSGLWWLRGRRESPRDGGTPVPPKSSRPPSARY